MIVKTVVITGASDGIGRTLAHAFSRRGFSLGLIARREELLQKVKEECLKLGARAVEVRAADVTNSPEYLAALSSLEETLQGVGYFIANAGIAGVSHHRRSNYKGIEKTLRVNLLSAIEGIEWMKEKMVARGSGCLIGMSSVAGARGLPEVGAYSVSKAGLTTYLEGLRIEMSCFGVDVITIAPGFIETAMTTELNIPKFLKLPLKLQVSALSKKYSKTSASLLNLECILAHIVS